MNHRRLMVIGNAPALTRGPFHGWLDPDAVARFIDDSDVVVRINYAENRSRPESGTRTDIVALMVDAETARERQIPRSLVAGAREVWLLRPDGRELSPLSPTDAWRQGRWRARNQEELIKFQEIGDKPLRFPGDDFHHELAARLRAPDRPLLPPSAGMVTIEMALSDPRFEKHDIYIAGFLFQGWHGHPMVAERKRIRELVASGRLKTLGHAGLRKNVLWNMFDLTRSFPKMVRDKLRRLYIRLTDPLDKVSGGVIR